MIISFASKATELFSLGQHVKSFENVDRAARLRLNRLKNAEGLADIANLPGHRFEKLRGDRAGQYSIRINDQWRICFTWDDDAKGFAGVEIVDYH